MPLHTIDAKTLRQWLDSHEAVLVDVREPAEHAAEKIPGAKPLPLGNIATGALPPHAGKKLVLHCRKGGRSSSACTKLLSESPALEVYNLDGGIEAWSAAGMATQRSGNSVLPLDRQVQLAIGLILIAANILGYMIGAGFYLLTLLIGIGLTLAGLTGFCGMARLLAAMPWNKK